jgi:hypothetical protein
VTTDPADTCDGTAKFVFEKMSTVDVTTTDSDGTSDQVVAAVTTSSTRDPVAKAFAQTKGYDVTRTDRDASGGVTRTTRTTGQLGEAFDGSGTAPARTLNGTMTHDDGSGAAPSQIAVTDVVFGAPDQCRWPIGGTVVQTLADGTTHTLVFSATCGSATLDGATAALPEHGVHLGPAGDDHHDGHQGRR